MSAFDSIDSLKAAIREGIAQSGESCGDDTYDALMERAHALGKEHGASAASWYFDGNTTRADYERVLSMLQDGDPEIYDTFPSSPLSGEWADGMTMRQLIDDLEVPEDDDIRDDVFTMYEDGYDVAVADTIEDDARAGLARLGEPDVDMDAHYSVDGYRGIAWSLVGFESSEVVFAVMVGDDRVFPIDVDDLTKIDDLDYCAECGQIGCTHDGRDRDDDDTREDR